MTKAREIAELGQKLTVDASGNLDIAGDFTTQGFKVADGTSGQIDVHSDSYNIQGGTNFGDLRFNAPRLRFYEDGTNIRLNIDGGDVSFYNTSGTAKFFWDASAESLKLGHATTVFGDNELDLVGGGNGVRSGMVWMRSGTGDSVHQINVNGSTLEFGSGGALDTTPSISIKSTGNVGIGTQTPDTKLHVSGSLVVDAFNTGNEEGIFFRDGFSASNKYNVSILAYDHGGGNPVSPDGLSINAYDGISFSTGSNTRNEVMRIRGGTANVGYVGIGTNPADLLHLKAASPTLRIENSSTSGVGAIEFWDAQGGTSQAASIRFDDNNNQFQIQGNANGTIFRTPSNTFPSTSETMRITSNNTVGIGTTSPSSGLHVKGAGSHSWITVENSQANNYSIVDFKNESNERVAYVGTYNGGDALYLYGAKNGPMQFFTDSAERMRISSTGDVGIGTNSPQEPLHVVGNSTRVDLLLNYSGVGTGASDGLQVGIQNTNGAYLWNFENMNTYFGTSNTRRMTIHNGGAVTVGNTTAVGSAGAGDLIVNGSIFLGGTGGANELTDVEHGTWTPTFARYPSNPSVTYSSQSGSYVKVGHLVFATFDVTASSISGGSGHPRINGLPFTVSNNTDKFSGYSAIQWRDAGALTGGTAGTQLAGWAERNSTFLHPQLDNSGGSYGNYGYPSWNSSGRLTGYIVYATDS